MKRFVVYLCSPRGALVLILSISLALRVMLIQRGGQFFWSDETRYAAVTSAWNDWIMGQRHDALLQIAGTADHLGFKFLMLLPAWLQLKTGATTAQPACFLALFSVANIFWVWLLARRMGAEEQEALWAAAGMAAAASMFYWVRHLVPYDAALCFGLACTYVALNPRSRLLNSCLAGILGFAAFVTYNGYWLVVACALTAHVMVAFPRWLEMGQRALFAFLGLVGPFVLMLIAAKCFDIDLLDSYADFAGSINQGNFNEGHVVFFDYLWQTERLSALWWGGAVLAFGWLSIRADVSARWRGGLWCAMIVAIAAALIIGSNVLEKFVVYGRLARQVVPFCALLGGWTAARLFRRLPPWTTKELLTLGGLLFAGAWSMSVPIRQDFPVPFHRKAIAVLQNYRRQHGPTATEPGRVRFMYNGFIWPVPSEPPLPPDCRILLAAPHPLAWRPYLYEGFNREQREQIDSTDITMRLVLLKN